MDAYVGVGCIAVALTLIMVIVVWLNSCHTYWTKRGVDTLPTMPLLGNTKDICLLREPIGISLKKTYDHFKAKGKRYAGYYFLLKPMFVPIDLELIKAIVIQDFNHFTDHIGDINEKGDPLSTHLFNQKGDRWKFLRPKLSSTFTSGKLRGMYDNMLDYSNQFAGLMEKIADGRQAIDIEHMTTRYSADIIISSIFGLKSRMLLGNDVGFEMCLKKLQSGDLKSSVSFLMLLTYPDLFAALKMRTYDKKMTDFFMNFTKQRLEQRSKSNHKQKDFVQLLLESGSTSTVDSERPLSLEEICGQYFVHFVAGIETVATAIYFTLFELSLNQDIQEKARNEIRNVRKNFTGELCYEATQELKYLTNCVTETLRKYAPVMLTTRLCTKEYKIPDSNVTIDKGTYVLIPIYGIHMDPEYFPSPETYDPDRFLEGSEKNRNAFAFMPLGFGPRMCIAHKFAMLESVIVLSVLLSRFRFAVHSDTKIPIRYSALAFSTIPSDPIMLTAERLNK